MSEYLCEELVDEIFQRLPVKSLVRLRSLSKYWFSRIASPDFIETHRLRSVNTPLKLLIKHYKHGCTRVVYTLLSENRLSLDYQTAETMDVGEVDLPTRDFEIVGSCNGILCVVDKEMKFSLWNPSIRRKLTIPVPPYYIGRRCDLALGFGVDPIADDYKIVMISNSKTNPLVYSMKTDTWSLINSPTIPFSYARSRACLVNGTLYWVVKPKLSERCTCIMTFDLSSNVCGTIEFPRPYLTGKLVVIKDSLAALYYTNDYSSGWLLVRMERINSPTSWSMDVRSPTWSLFDEPVGRVLQLTNGDYLLHRYNLGLTVYNPERGVSSFPCSYTFDIIDMETYAESLVLLDTGVVCKGNQKSCDVEAKRYGRKRKKPK